ncbi:MAG: hypothetical protein IKR18_02720 [Bacteroidaceae bacterium]|nr:hypothetical protein [Bacteroidaceae bacterium]
MLVSIKHIYQIMVVALGAATIVACSSDNDIPDPEKEVVDPSVAEQFYTGGQLGTSFVSSSKAYEQPTPAVNQSNMFLSFNRGEKMFEKPFTSNTNGGEREGLGPLYIRSSCIHCHPGYGHGKSLTDGYFNTTEVGNGSLLVVYDPTTNAYVQWLAGMPQTHAIAPFKSPLDETKITVHWENFVDEWGNKFPDGETYSLRYPEVTLPREAVYVINQGYEDATTSNYEVRLESTIGIYGSGLLDAIDDDSIIAQYRKEYADGLMKNGLNPAIFSNGEYTGYYANSNQGDGTKRVRRLTYAISRGPLSDGPGSNALWNITNVTRSDRRYHYLDLNGTIYATYASKDPDIQAGFPEYIARISNPIEHPEWFGSDVEQNIYNYLTSKNLDAEISDDDFVDFMVWHRGLAVPAARNIDNPTIQHGKKLFEEIGCAYCHRPSWKTGSDKVYDPNLFRVKDSKSANYGKDLADIMPRYPNQKIWPYTDLVQHKLFMKNDIRTGWCRTTPLWGRGLHQLCTGSAYADRLHDCRARNVIEAIMWHATNQGGTSDAYYPVKQFRNLPKADRDAIVAFIDAI